MEPYGSRHHRKFAVLSGRSFLQVAPPPPSGAVYASHSLVTKAAKTSLVWPAAAHRDEPLLLPEQRAAVADAVARLRALLRIASKHRRSRRWRSSWGARNPSGHLCTVPLPSGMTLCLLKLIRRRTRHWAATALATCFTRNTLKGAPETRFANIDEECSSVH